MPRSLNDRLLLGGAVVTVVAACILARANIKPAANNDPGNLGPLLLGTTIAFVCALIAVGTDLQNSVTSRLGALANTSILQSWQGCTSLVGWGAFDAMMFQVVLINPSWASQTFHFDVGNNLAGAGLAVGISAIVIIRSKLFKQGNVEWGAEWIYLWSSAQVLDAVNRHRIAIKRSWETRFRPASSNVAGYPNFFTDLETSMTAIMQGRSPQAQAALTEEFQRLRRNYIPAGDPHPDATVNANPLARQYLVSAVLDHVGHTELADWARDRRIST